MEAVSAHVGSNVYLCVSVSCVISVSVLCAVWTYQSVHHMWMCVCVCVCVWMCVHLCALCMSMCPCVHVWGMCVCEYVYMCGHVSVCACVVYSSCDHWCSMMSIRETLLPTLLLPITLLLPLLSQQCSGYQ